MGVGVPSLVKQPGESRLYTMDFSSLMATGETITAVTNVAYTGDDALLVVGSPTYSGQQAQVRISGGTNEYSYRVTFTVTTSSGDTLQGEGILQVRSL